MTAARVGVREARGARLAAVVAPSTFLAVAVATVALAAWATGATAAPALGMDPGVAVRWGLPVLRVVMNGAIAVVLGALVLAVFAFRADERAYAHSLDLAAGGAFLWATSAAVSLVLTYLSLGSRFSFDEAFALRIVSFGTQVELGTAWLVTVAVGLAVATASFAVRHPVAVAVVAVVAVLGQIPLALQGHSGSNADHDLATTALFLHVVGAAVWVGGLLVLVLCLPVLDRRRLVAVVPRFSSLAGVAFAVVAFSGVLRAIVGVGDLAGLVSPYGALVLAKTVVFLLLGIAGVLQRRVVIRRLDTAVRPRRVFATLVLIELVLLAFASGVASALSRTATPVPETDPSQYEDPSTAELLTGRPVPPVPGPLEYLTNWAPDPLWIVACVAGLSAYVAGVARLRRRGDAWPVGRTVSWVAGVLLMAWATNGGLSAYEPFLFSSHMTLHMVVGMLVPLLLVPGAPITLALRALRRRDDGSRGPREWLLTLVHGAPARVLTHPAVAAVLFVGSLWVFYYSPLFAWAVRDHVGHEWMLLHFVLTGFLFTSTMIGVDPLPRRAPHAARLVILLASMAVHAFFGLSVMSATTLFLPEWYGAMDWAVDPLADQRAAGGIAWSLGEVPTVALAVIVAVGWSRSDRREARRRDRAAERDGDAELRAYNAMLASRRRGGSA